MRVISNLKGAQLLVILDRAHGLCHADACSVSTVTADGPREGSVSRGIKLTKYITFQFHSFTNAWPMIGPD